jgi:hypothetical protein
MVKVTETKTFVLQGWPGGLNSEDFEHLRKADEAEVTDFKFGPRGEVEVRKGLDLLAAHDTWTGGAGANKRLGSLFAYTPDAGASKFLVAVDTDGKVWHTGAGPSDTIVKARTVAPAQIDFGAITVVPDATTLDGYFVLVCEDQHVRYWPIGTVDTWVEVTDHTLDDSGREAAWEFPISSTVCSAFSRAWAAGNDTYPSRLFWSGAVGTLIAGTADPAGPWNWPATNWVDINPEDGGAITKIFPFGQAIIVFKNNSMYAFIGAGDPTTARLYPLHGNIGCTLPATVAESTGRLFWASIDGVYSYDGSGVARIDGKVRNALTALAVAADSLWANGYAVGEKYHLHYPTALYVYDTEGERWELHTDSGWGSALFLDQPYVTRWGGIYRTEINEGYDDTASAAGVLSTPSVPCSFKTSWLPPPDQRTGSQYRVRRVDLYLDRPSVSGTMACRYMVRLFADYGETIKVVGYDLNVDTLQTVAEPFIVSLPGYGALLDSFRLTVDPVASASGNERIVLNSVAVLLSERAAKRSRMLPAGVIDEP